MRKQKRLQNKIALITGASRGIGAAIAKRYAEEGAHVLLLARRIDLLEHVDDEIRSRGGASTLIPVDLEDLNKLPSLGPLILERFGSLDIFVANAGIQGNFMPLLHMDFDSWEKILKVNLTVNWILLKTLDPLLRQAKTGHVMGVTSSEAHTLKAYRGVYAISKRALEGLFLLYANETKGTSIKVNLVDPGNVATDMRAKAFPGENPKTLPLPEEITDVFVNLALSGCSLHGQIINAQDGKGF